MNDRVVKNPNFKSETDFHRSLTARGAGAKGWPNTHTEVEHLGGGKFGASIGVGHRVFFDKADGNKPKKHKLTDERPGKDYILIQGAKCCVEVYPYYAKYFDVQHEEVRVEEERWVIQRLFKEPNEWRDVGAYNPQIAVEEYSEPAGDVVKVTVTYDTDYGPLAIEYFQRDGNALKHNVAFKNTSSSAETFRVLQRWAGIVGNKVKTHEREYAITGETILKSDLFIFGDDTHPFRISENTAGIEEEGAGDILEMLTGRREPSEEEITIATKDNLTLIAYGDNVSILDSQKRRGLLARANSSALSIMKRATENCPENARVFVGSLDLGLVLLPLALTHKAYEVIVCEENEWVKDTIAPLVEGYFRKHYPQFNLQIIHGNIPTELARLGSFDWMFEGQAYLKEENRGIYLSHLTTEGVYSSWVALEAEPTRPRALHFDPVKIDIHPNGLKADFIYSNWLLAQDESLEIDPDSATLDDPTEDGHILLSSQAGYSRDKTGIRIKFGREENQTQVCFAKDTKILMSNGQYKPAEKIEEGDLVKYYSFKGHCLLDTEITAVFAHTHKGKLITLNGVLKLTGDHPLVRLNGSSIRADELKVGDVIQGVEGSVSVKTIEAVCEELKVYSFYTESKYYFVADLLTVDEEMRYRGYVEWDVSSIPVGSEINNMRFWYHGEANSEDGHIHEMVGHRPSTSTDQEVYDEAGEGNVYRDEVGFPEVGIDGEIYLSGTAEADLVSLLSVGWFAIGLQGDDEGTEMKEARIYSENKTDAADPKPTLYVSYTPPPAGLENKSANMAAKMIAGKLI